MQPPKSCRCHHPRALMAPLHGGAVLLLGQSLEEPRAIDDSGLRRTRGPPCSSPGSWRSFCTCSGTKREAAMRYDALPKGSGGFLPACIRTSGAREAPGAGAVPAREPRALGELQPRAELGLDESSVPLILFRGKRLLCILGKSRREEGRLVGFCRKTSQSSVVSHVAFCLFFPYRNSAYCCTGGWHHEK